MDEPGVFIRRGQVHGHAQVVKTVRRRRLVRVQHRVVFGTLQAVHAVLAPLGCQINTAFIEVRPVGRKEAEASG